MSRVKKHSNDISGLANIHELYESSPLKKWIKLISFNKTIPLDEYTRKEYFTHVADIVLDTETFSSGKKEGMKKRNTLIKFIPKVPLPVYNRKTEWLYLLTINGRIVKIGGTRAGLKERVGSYLCGHHIAERGKSGDCSKTNGFIYNTFLFYLEQGCKMEMYGYELPKTEAIIDIFGVKKTITVQTYHTYESVFLQDYKKTYRDFPILSINSDPEYREMTPATD